MSTAREPQRADETLFFRLTFSSLLFRTFQVMRIGWPKILLLCLVALSPLLVASVLPVELGVLAIPLTTLVLLPLASGAVTHSVFELLRGKKSPSIGKSLGLATKKLPILVLASIAANVVITVGFLLCILPGFIALAGLFVFAPAIMVEKAGPIDALQRSADLTAGYRIPIFLFLILAVVLEFASTLAFDLDVLVAILEFLSTTFIGSIPKALSILWILFLAAEWVVTLAIYSTIACAASVAYFDLRLTKEAIDEEELLVSFD